ncbi:MAG: hypothetical protein WCY15_01645 [Phenylobacterium sp.]|uniref:hypothetical protein n=1 Tax=Phenylobacterium sp. TaxID=1871053 RepID=UPI00355D75CE
MTWDDDDYYDVCVGVGKSRRYHAMMRDFYRRCADTVTAVSAISGTSAFVALFLQDRNSTVAKWLTATIAVASILNLVFGFSKKADLHDKLCRRFTQLAADMTLWPATEENLAKARAERLLIEMDEPTERRLIDLRATNDEWRSRGVEIMLPLGFFQKTWLAYFCDFGLSGVERRFAKLKASR